MTDFAVELRHRCRNPKCRCKLPEPTPNPREAFCTRGCHTSFYLHRCIVCERPIERTRGDGPQVCKKPDRRRVWKAQIGFGRYIGSSAATKASETPDFIGLKQPIRTDQAWRQVAGSPLTPEQLRYATIPDGRSGNWAGGRYRRLEAESRALLRAAEAAEIEANGSFADPGWRAIVMFRRRAGLRCRRRPRRPW